MVREKSVNLSDVRKSNCRLIFEMLSRNNGMTLLELEQKTGLSRPTTVSMVRALEEADLVLNVGKKESNGGRTPSLYGINPDAYYAIGIDFEYPISRVAISDMSGIIRYGSKKEFLPELKAVEAIEALIDQIREVIEKSGVEERRILGIGMGMPGYINLKTGMSLRFERIFDWKDIEIGKLISKSIRVPVYMENDVHLMFRAERGMWGKNVGQDALFIAIRSGIGMAIFQRGHIIEGEYGNAGHIGHMVIQANGPKCKCGNYGCLELYASELAIRQNYEERTGIKTETVNEIVDNADQGEEAALQVLKEAGRYLGIGIGNVVNLFDINTIIVSSYFNNHHILKSAQQEVDRCVNIPQERKVQIYPSQLEEKNFALGGCQLVFRRNQEEILMNVPLKNL